MIKERLDRFFINEEMNRRSEKILVKHRGFHQSDHRAIVAFISFMNQRKKSRKTAKWPRFEGTWLEFEECKNVIKSNCTSFKGFGFKSIHNRIMFSLEKLSKWNKEMFKGSVDGVIDRNMTEIQDNEAKNDSRSDPKLLQVEKDLEKLLDEEELYWKLQLRED